MIRLARSIGLTLILGACAQVRATPEGPGATPPSFPGDWIGSWEGAVHTAAPGGALTPRFQMKRIVAATEDPGVYTWTTIYSGDAGDQTRNYLLIERDAASGQYAIDEQNGIVLDATLLGDSLYSWFEVQGTRLLVRERLQAGPDGAPGWSFEILTSGGESGQTGDQIAVEVLPVTGLQRAWLRRVD